MLFWHLGATSFLFRWIFRDPLVDLRWLWLGALAPNLVDVPVAAALGFPDDAYRLWGHTMLFPIVLMGGVLVLTRRGSRRTKLLALTVGVFFHLALDRMWVLPETLLWPFLGRAFSSMGVSGLADLLGTFGWWTLAGEVIGAAYLGLIWGWAPPEDRAAFPRTGVLTLGAPTK
jgi:membrane-bound metal-dependent hydrolase YbcI (DUF457 family)